MDRSIGVLYVIDELLQLGGAEQNLVRILRHLPRDRFRPYLLTFRFNPTVEAFRSLPCPVEVYPVHNLYGWNAMLHAPRLLSWCRRERIGIVHTFFETADLWAGSLARAGTRARLISGRRDLGIQRNVRLNILYRMLGRPLFHQVQAVSDQVRDYVIASDRLDPAKVVTVPNGIDLGCVPQREAGARSQWELPESRPWIVTVANIRPVKGIDLLVRSAELVCRSRPDALFVVAGRILDQDYYSEIEAQVKHLGLAENIRFLGQVDAPLTLLSAADIFFLPSRSEGMSNALLEAMASSLPAVATAVGGNCQLVDENSTGFLVPVGDTDAAAGRLLQFLEDPQLARRMGAAARRVVEQRYSLEATMRLLIRHYEALLEG